MTSNDISIEGLASQELIAFQGLFNGRVLLLSMIRKLWRIQGGTTLGLKSNNSYWRS